MAPTPAGRPRFQRLAALQVRAAALLLAAPVLLAACGTISMSAPPATPTNFPGLNGRLNTAGIKLSDWVAGDPGCANTDLAKTAIRFKATGLDQAEPVTMYLYIFGNAGAFQRNREAVPPCAAAFVTDPATFEQVEQSPYVIASQGPWAPRFKAALRATLEAAAGTGG